MMWGNANSGYITKNIVFFCLVSSVASLDYDLATINSNLKEFNGYEDMFNKIRFNMFFNKKKKDNNGMKFNDLKHSDFGKKNKVLVKRIVPHGYKTGPYEYDAKFDVFYRPLVKVHRHPKRFSEAEDNSKGDESNFRSKDALLLQPFLSTMQKKRPNQQQSLANIVRQLLQTLKSLLEGKGDIKLPKLLKNLSRRNKESAMHLLRVLASLFTDEATLHEAVETILRLSNRGRNGVKSSGEEQDPVPHEGHLIWPDEGNEVKKKDVLPPQYSLWDYWTYGKPLHADECPAHQVKINNMCVWTPPH